MSSCDPRKVPDAEPELNHPIWERARTHGHYENETLRAACSIPATELRGITLRQLLGLLAKIDRLADEKGYLQEWKDIKDKTCRKDTVNLYDLTKYYVMPETKERKCSYVELVAPPGTVAQTPRWFVSHWWGEPVKDFIVAVHYHARQRFAPRGVFKTTGQSTRVYSEHFLRRTDNGSFEEKAQTAVARR